jgi:hypothetical protein
VQQDVAALEVITAQLLLTRESGVPYVHQRLLAKADLDVWLEQAGLLRQGILPLPAHAVDTARPERPRRGWVYLLESGGLYKIGRTWALPARLQAFRTQVPQPVVLIHALETARPEAMEHMWHQHFADRRRHGEWFELTADDVETFRQYEEARR